MVETRTAAEPKHEFPCQACGANLTFVPGSESLKCGYCGHEQNIGSGEQKPIVEYSFDKALALARRKPSTEILAGGSEVHCNACGANTVVSGKAARCPFCDSPVVLSDHPEEVFVPESLLPFQVDKPRAGEVFKVWVKSRWFAPSDLALRARAEGMDGVYLPFWTYDSNTTTAYTGQRGTHYYVTESYTENGQRKTRQVRKTRWHPAFGTVRVPFDDVLVPATKALPQALLQKLEPWDLAALATYDPGYLSGFLANRYDIALDEGFELAEDRMEPVIRERIRRDIGGDEQMITSMRVRHQDVTFKHLLLPVWISSFRYGEKVFRFVVNARTGEAAGERPYSAVKIALAVIAALILIAVAIGLYQSSQATG